MGKVSLYKVALFGVHGWEYEYQCKVDLLLCQEELQDIIREMVRPYVLITGGSSGIGFELSRLFAREGNPLLIIAKDKKKLEIAYKRLKKEFPSSTVKTILKDLSRPESAQEIYEITQSKKILVGTLINNAGFANRGQFLEIAVEKEREQMYLNMVTLTLLTKLFLPDMVKRKKGKILNVSSTAAFQPGPLMAVYYASKAYVLSFSEGLSIELQGTGVTVTALCPGPTRTNFELRAGMQNTLLFKMGVMDARTVAEIGYQALMEGKRVAIPGMKNKFFAFVRRFLPRDITARVAHWLQR